MTRNPGYESPDDPNTVHAHSEFEVEHSAGQLDEVAV